MKKSNTKNLLNKLISCQNTIKGIVIETEK